jgi:hypothetical protein
MRQVSAVWVDWFLEVYMTIMADLEHLGLGPFECANINSMPSGTHALFMAARTCAQINLFGMSYTGDLVFERSGHVQYAPVLSGFPSVVSALTACVHHGYTLYRGSHSIDSRCALSSCSFWGTAFMASPTVATLRHTPCPESRSHASN